MKKRNKYSKLDEIGFLGIQDKRTTDRVNKDIQMTVNYIKAMKSGNNVSVTQKHIKDLSKA
jgi:ribosomal protein S25